MKTFKIVMMSKNEIKIDPEEIPKVLEAIKTSSPAILKQGIFNPSRYDCILEDKRELDREVDENNHYTGRMISKPLPDIFEGIESLARLKTEDIKRLKS